MADYTHTHTHTHTHTKSAPYCGSWHIKLKTVQYLCNMFQNIYQNESDITTVLQRGGMFLHSVDTQLPDYMMLCPAVHSTSMKNTNLSSTT